MTPESGVIFLARWPFLGTVWLYVSQISHTGTRNDIVQCKYCTKHVCITIHISPTYAEKYTIRWKMTPESGVIFVYRYPLSGTPPYLLHILSMSHWFPAKDLLCTRNHIRSVNTLPVMQMQNMLLSLQGWWWCDSNNFMNTIPYLLHTIIEPMSHMVVCRSVGWLLSYFVLPYVAFSCIIWSILRDPHFPTFKMTHFAIDNTTDAYSVWFNVTTVQITASVWTAWKHIIQTSFVMQCNQFNACSIWYHWVIGEMTCTGSTGSALARVGPLS